VIRRLIVMIVAIACGTGCAERPDGQSSTRVRGPSIAGDEAPLKNQLLLQKQNDAALFAELDKTFGGKGEVKDGVYRLVTPRPDLFVTLNGMDVPTGAFLESDFRFWHCPCGKALVNGQFVVADYEANDVIDELQVGHLEIAAVGPLLLNERPRLMLIRFQGEGEAKQLATTLKSALSYTGEARNQPAPANLSPPAD
jgi:hypothetical protein